MSQAADPRPWPEGRAWRLVQVAAIAVLLVSFPLYRVLIIAYYQIGWVRVLGLMLALEGLAIGLAMGLAWAAAAIASAKASPFGLGLGLQGLMPAGRLVAGLRLLCVTGALANGLAVGLSMAYLQPRLAPPLYQGLAALLLVVLVARYAWLPREHQRIIEGVGVAGGVLAIAVPLFATPWMLAAYWEQPERIAASPFPTHDQRTRPGAPRLIVLVSFDALRARSVNLTPGNLATPSFAAIAAESTAFINCRTMGDRTLCAVPTLLSGVRPHEIVPRLQNKSAFIRHGDLTGIAAHLAPAGYTSRYITMLVAPSLFGLTDEFAGGHHFMYHFLPNDFNTRSFIPIREAFAWLTRNYLPEPSPYTASVTHQLVAVRETFAMARKELVSASQPTFLWLHIAAPHSPFFDVPFGDDAAPEHPERYRRVAKTMLDLMVKAEDVSDYATVYERYVHFVDREVGRFVAGLREDGTLKDALVVLTADHGEQFKAGFQVHGFSNISEDVTRVPLLIHQPGQTTPQVVRGLVGTEDIVPTLLDQVYVSPQTGFPGRAILDRPIPDDRTLFTWSCYERFIQPEAKKSRGAIAAYQGSFKYELHLDTGEQHLYDLAHDPNAQHDVYVAKSALAATLRAAAERELLVPEPDHRP